MVWRREGIYEWGSVMLVAPGERHVLFLQGPGSFFFLRLAQACKAVGMTASKINLCAGDYVFWPGGAVTPYRGSFADWPAFIEHYLVSNGVSDVVLFSDSRPYHRIATDIAHGLGINVFVFENGYFRPTGSPSSWAASMAAPRFPRIRPRSWSWRRRPRPRCGPHAISAAPNG